MPGRRTTGIPYVFVTYPFNISYFLLSYHLFSSLFFPYSRFFFTLLFIFQSFFFLLSLYVLFSFIFFSFSFVFSSSWIEIFFQFYFCLYFLIWLLVCLFVYNILLPLSYLQLSLCPLFLCSLPTPMTTSLPPRSSQSHLVVIEELHIQYHKEVIHYYGPLLDTIMSLEICLLGVCIIITQGHQEFTQCGSEWETPHS